MIAMANIKKPVKEVSNEEMLEAIKALYAGPRLAFRAASSSWLLDGEGISVEDLVNDIAFETHFPVGRIKIVLERLGKIRKTEAFGGLTRWVVSLEEQIDDSELNAWLKLMEAQGLDPLERAANRHVLKQWIWQVKRNILHKKVEWHVMPIFWSTVGGTGKSYNIRRLMKPIESYWKEMSVSDINEKFGDKMLSLTFAIFFDEFDGIGKLDITTFRSIMTGKAFDRRGMYADTATYKENRLSLIASTNLDPPHGYEDESGARRIWSIKTSSEQARKGSPRVNALDAIDFEKVWRCVSVKVAAPEETIDSALKDFMAKRRHDQLRAKTALESFCDDMLVVSTGRKIYMAQFKEHFSRYCVANRMVMPKQDHAATARALRQLGHVVKNHNNKLAVKDVALIELKTIEENGCLSGENNTSWGFRPTLVSMPITPQKC